MTTEAEKDIAGIMRKHMEEHGITPLNSEDVLKLMTEAWRYGYTTGIKDAADFEDLLSAEKEARNANAPTPET